MSIRNIDWIDGAPDRLQAGMLIEMDDKPMCLIGGPIDRPPYTHSFKSIKRWAWVIKPHELDWIADMAQRNGKGRPEQ